MSARGGSSSTSSRSSQRLGFAGFFLVMWDAVQFAGSTGHPGTGARECRQLRRGVLPRDHRRRSGGERADVRAVPVRATDGWADGGAGYRHRHRARSPRRSARLHVRSVRPRAFGDHGRWCRPIGRPTRCSMPCGRSDIRRRWRFRCLKRVHRYDPAEGAAWIGAELGRSWGSTSRMRGGARCCGQSPRSRAFRACARPIPAGSCCRPAPLGDYSRSSPRPWGGPSCSSTRMISTGSACRSSIFSDWGRCRSCGGRSTSSSSGPGIGHRCTSCRPTIRRRTISIAQGDTVGTFQIESRAQISSIVHTRPERMYDIVVQVALIRPGPIQARFVHPYTRRRRGQEPVTYRHPALIPILERTQGIPIFQEQAMAIARDLGGYTGAQADELRRTMGNMRKQPQLEAALDRLRTRMIGQGIAPDVAAQIVDDLKSFANYGFPESHAWSFALIAYATAYLKTHCPAEFYARRCSTPGRWGSIPSRRSSTMRSGGESKCARRACAMATGSARSKRRKSRSGRRCASDGGTCAAWERW